MKDPWLYNIEHDLSGSENMRRDMAMAEACMIDQIPRLRLYSWRPWTLSLGYNQSEGGIDRDAISNRGYEIVRRPTGGRAVFHADELTYAVAMPYDSTGLQESYGMITGALRRGLEMLGADDLEFSRSQPDFRSHYELEESASCFSASALNELTWQRRKLIGSAQRRFGSILLQHGSLLLGDAHLEIIDLLYPDMDESRRGMLRKRLAERTATLRMALGEHLPDFDTIAEAITEGFASTFDGDMIRCEDCTVADPHHLQYLPRGNG